MNYKALLVCILGYCLYSFNLISSDLDKTNLASAAAAAMATSSSSVATANKVYDSYWRVTFSNGLIITTNDSPESFVTTYRINGVDYKPNDIIDVRMIIKLNDDY